MKEIANKLITIASMSGEDTQVSFNRFLDYAIECFSLERLIEADGDYNIIFEKLKRENHRFFPVFADFIIKSAGYIAENDVYDFFGNIYEEMFQSGRKAATMGQFFTPQTIGDICAKIIYDGCNAVVSEPSCGSGRNLLSIFARNKSISHYFIAEDLDSVSVKMCALNMVINGMRGCCICHNTLFPEDFIFGYEVNEVRYPFPCNCYSIRFMTERDYKNKLKMREYD